MTAAGMTCDWCEKPIEPRGCGMTARRFCSDYCRMTEFRTRGEMASLMGEAQQFLAVEWKAGRA